MAQDGKVMGASLNERLREQADWLTPEAATEHLAGESMRAEFEAWATSIGMTTEQTSNGVYIRHQTFYAWLGWKTALSRRDERGER